MPTSNRILKHHKLVLPVTFQQADPSTFTKCWKLPREVNLIAIHVAQMKKTSNAAEALASWLAGAGHPKGASFHLAVDCDSITQSVELDDVAWHAGPINGYSIGIEQAGMSEQTAAQWDDDYSRSMLANTAKLIAVLTGIYDIPIDHVNPRAQGVRGVCTHYDVTKAWSVKGGHWDPGPNYPLDKVLDMARAFQLEAVS